MLQPVTRERPGQLEGRALQSVVDATVEEVARLLVYEPMSESDLRRALAALAAARKHPDKWWRGRANWPLERWVQALSPVGRGRLRGGAL